VNHIELRAAGVDDMTPLEFALPVDPNTCIFVEVIEAFARACDATHDARFRAAVWGVRRGFDHPSQAPGEFRLSDLSVSTLTDVTPRPAPRR
jgi:hypothetical protein